MLRMSILALSLFTLLLVAGCASGSGTAAPAATAPSAAPAASEPAESAAAGGGGCTASSETGAVSVGIENFAFAPADVTAAVGQTITWTNADSAPHTATTDDGACDTGSIAQNASAGLVFDAAGTYPYHCNIHPNMKGTITITE